MWVPVVGHFPLADTAPISNAVAARIAAAFAGMCGQAGKKGLIVVSRKDTSFHIDTTYYGNTVRSDPDGYQTELDVVFVDPAALPPQYADAGWRVIDADAVYAALAPVYLKPTASR